MKKITYILILVIIFSVFISLYYFLNHKENTIKNSNLTEANVNINNKVINIAIADELHEQWLGLSNRNELCADCGMLFIFPDKKERTFVMREMKFPIDIIWINDNQILRIDKNLKPDNKQTENEYYSYNSVNYVLEVNGGFCDKNNIKEGQITKYNY